MVYKKVLAGVLAATLAFSGVFAAFPKTAKAETSAVDSSEWNKYANRYIYNQLNADEQKFYDALMEECQLYMTGGGDLESSRMPGVSYGALSREKARQIYTLFWFENPQFYYVYGNWDADFSDGKLYPHAYDKFIKEADRLAGASAIKEKIDEYDSVVSKEKNDYDKIKKIHDMILDDVTRNPEANGTLDPEQHTFSQSIWSPLMMGKTVCKGYGVVFYMLCNKQGIECVQENSNDHIYNRVKLDGIWYMVDVSHDDDMAEAKGVHYVYDWFLKSYDTFQKMDPNGHHKTRDFFVPYMPEAKQDYNSILVPSSNAMNGDAICTYPVGEVFLPKMEYLEAMRAVDLDFPEFTFGELFKNGARVKIDWNSSVVKPDALDSVTLLAYDFENREGKVAIKEVKSYYSDANNDPALFGNFKSRNFNLSSFRMDTKEYVFQIKLVYNQNGKQYKQGFFYVPESSALVFAKSIKQIIIGPKSSYTYKASKLKKEAVSFNLNAKAKTALSYKVTKGAKYVSVDKAGKVMLKKGTPKGNYKIKITAAKAAVYVQATKTIIIKVK